MARGINDTFENAAEHAIGAIQHLYGLIFPEFPDVGVIIILIAILTIIVELVKKQPIIKALKSGGAIFLTLTVLFFFLHFMIVLFVMLQHHSL